MAVSRLRLVLNARVMRRGRPRKRRQVETCLFAGSARRAIGGRLGAANTNNSRNRTADFPLLPTHYRHHHFPSIRLDSRRFYAF